MEQFVPVLEAIHDTLDGTDDPYRIYALAAYILEAQGDARAESTREQDNSLLLERVKRIQDSELRERFDEVHVYQTLENK